MRRMHHTCIPERTLGDGYCSSRSARVNLTDFLFDPLPREAPYQLLTFSKLSISQKIMKICEICLIGGSGQDKFRPIEQKGPFVFYAHLWRPQTALQAVLDGPLSLIDRVSAPICVIAEISIPEFITGRSQAILREHRARVVHTLNGHISVRAVDE